jgi:hypothetical protein
MRMSVFCVVAPCSLLEVYHVSEVLAASIIRAIIYQTTLLNNPADSHVIPRFDSAVFFGT